MWSGRWRFSISINWCSRWGISLWCMYTQQCCGRRIICGCMSRERYILWSSQSCGLVVQKCTESQGMTILCCCLGSLFDLFGLCCSLDICSGRGCHRMYFGALLLTSLRYIFSHFKWNWSFISWVWLIGGEQITAIWLVFLQNS